MAVERGRQLVDWTADRNDFGLLSFYSGLGAIAQHEKVFYRRTGGALTQVGSIAELLTFQRRSYMPVPAGSLLAIGLRA